MKKALLGKKIGMMGIWSPTGERVAVTALQLGPCPVVQVKTPEKDGYSALQIGYGSLSVTRASKAEMGHLKPLIEAGGTPVDTLVELRDFPENKNVGEILDVTLFAEGDLVFVSGVSKGKGFQGVVKRYGFRGGRMSHGSKFHRSTGSVGAGTDPSEVLKGKRMPGRMGGKKHTVKNLEIVKIIPDENIVLVKGAVPGRRGGEVLLYQK